MTDRFLADFLQHAHLYGSRTQALRNSLFPESAYKTAAVLLALVPKDGQWQIMLTRRSAALRHHTGQIALAGGRREAQDADLTQTALRETLEETGIATQLWQTFPVLPPHYTPSGYEVHPVPALCTGFPEIRANPDEVAEVFFVPFDFAVNPANYRTRSFTHQGRTAETPALPFRHYDIWGLTAVILYGLAERYRQYVQAV